MEGIQPACIKISYSLDQQDVLARHGNKVTAMNHLDSELEDEDELGMEEFRFHELLQRPVLLTFLLILVILVILVIVVIVVILVMIFCFALGASAVPRHPGHDGHS